MKIILLRTLTCFIAIIAMSYTSTADGLRIGAASVSVTPPIGTPLAGYYNVRLASGIHDELYAKALVIEKDDIKIAIVECDFVGIPDLFVNRVREIVNKAIGIDATNIMIGATHSHTGPVIPDDPSWLTNSPSYLGRRGIDPKSEAGQTLFKYISKLPELIAESVIKANAALKPAKLSFGMGQEGSISFNRRFFMTDGTLGWNPGLHNPKIIRPAGPIDPIVNVLLAETIDNKAISTLVNFALHLDEVGGTNISSDLAFTLSNVLAKYKGDDMVTIFSQGCSGNINHINVNGNAPQSGNFRAKMNGTILAGEVIKTYPRMSSLNIDKIKIKSEIINVPLAEISKEELSWARKTAATFGKPNAAPFYDLVKAVKMVRVAERNGNPLPTEIQVFVLGDSCAIVSFPNEMFTELGQYLKKRSPYPYTIITEITNGYAGYIPDRKAYIEGGYEPLSTRAAAGSGEIMVENALRMLYELKNE